MIILVELVQRQLFAEMLQNRCIKHLWKSDILSKDAGRTCIFTWNLTLAKVFFEHFANKNQLPGLSVSGTLVENVFNSNFAIFIGKHPCTRFPANIAINLKKKKKNWEVSIEHFRWIFLLVLLWFIESYYIGA